ncbi:MAG: TonB-dependent receptor plug domain-containing protein [Chitinophagales bacterium]|nr:TonB-dependent receptor plug domain-containing protein [Chitinophagales bacterium]
MKKILVFIWFIGSSILSIAQSDTLKFKLKTTKISNAKKSKKPPILNEIKQSLKLNEFQTNPSGNLETMLKFQGLGVGGNNELSSSYQVRGGNFDENLVYVNGFEIYRPQLIKNAQQEGLSFVNPDMVDKLTFSSGGFNASYGDKMSSVLDIEYKKFKKPTLSIQGSFMGGNIHGGYALFNEKLNGSTAIRYRNNALLLSSQETQGEYAPVFFDIQNYWHFRVDETLRIEWLTYFAENNFRLQPKDRFTRFGLFDNALGYQVNFSGQEIDKYQQFMNGISIKKMFYENVFVTFQQNYNKLNESQNFDITGQYRIGAIETDLQSTNFNDFKSILGAGTFQNWGRDNLDADLLTHSLNLAIILDNHQIRMGFTDKREWFTWRMSLWDRLDSSGYNVGQNAPNFGLDFSARGNFKIRNQKQEFFMTHEFMIPTQKGKFTINYGLRGNRNQLNQSSFLSPRANLTYQPDLDKDWKLKLAVGSYNQQPLLREYLNIYGQFNENVLHQQSIHYILGNEFVLKFKNRPFKFTQEFYFKDMTQVNSYLYNNVLMRYDANNTTRAYAYGVDFRVQGEFVKDAESWLSFSWNQTKENLNQTYYRYIDAEGKSYQIKPYGREIVDSVAYRSQWISRPSEQPLSFNLFFQDYLPKLPQFKVHLNFVYASGMPFSLPYVNAFRNAYRMSAYNRVDLGFSLMLKDPQNKADMLKWFSKVQKAWIAVEIFNLFGVENDVSMTWIKDYSNTSYAIPNNLTGRRLNLKFQVTF